ncbi:MAG: hypothetical protein IKF47_01265 [Bacilli bacterium]|nr:hypothetical protein [Bacilli bacterium]
MDEEKDELEVNKKNREDFENLMQESSSKRDAYWDSNNPAVRIVLLIIGTIIIVGSAYFIFKFINR